jgi:cytochrome c biogenesis protein CcmG, thiol:disulfide interchange protein DsbE
MSNRPVANKSKAATTGPDRRTPLAIWIGLGVIVLVALLLAISLSSSEESSDLTTGQVEATGRVLPPLDPSAITDPAIGMTAPELVGRNFADEPVAIVDDGTPRVLVFLAHWCPVCQDEVPALVAWSKDGGDTGGVEVVAVATAIDRTRANYPPGAWLRREGWPWQTLVDDADNVAATAYALSAFPYFVAIDADGNVVERLTGRVDAAGFESILGAARTGAPAVASGGNSTPVPG